MCFKSIYDLLGLNERILNAHQQRIQLQQNGADSKTDNIVIPESAVARTDQIFSKMDIDSNNVITEAEFISGCLQDKFLYQMLTADYSEGY